MFDANCNRGDRTPRDRTIDYSNFVLDAEAIRSRWRRSLEWSTTIAEFSVKKKNIAHESLSLTKQRIYYCV